MMSGHLGAVVVNDTGQAMSDMVNRLNKVGVNNFSLIDLSTMCATSTR